MTRAYNDNGLLWYPLHAELDPDKTLFEELERRDREIHRLEQERGHWKKLYHEAKDACEQQQQQQQQQQKHHHHHHRHHHPKSKRSSSPSSQTPIHRHCHGQQEQRADMAEPRRRHHREEYTRHPPPFLVPEDSSGADMQGPRLSIIELNEFSGGAEGEDGYVLGGGDESDDDLEKCSTAGNWGSDCSASLYRPDGPLVPDKLQPTLNLSAGPLTPLSRWMRSRRRRRERGSDSRHVHFADEVTGRHWQSPRAELVELDVSGADARDASPHGWYVW